MLTVFLNTEQLVELVKIVLSFYKDLRILFFQLKNKIDIDIKQVINPNLHNINNNNGFSSTDFIASSHCITPILLYQPELDFEYQPELFDCLL